MAAAGAVAVKQGMNRFTWDMRYPDARDFPGLIMWAGSTRGPAGAARQVSGAADRSRRHEDAGLRDQAQRGRADCHRRGPPGAVQARQGDQRQGHRRERGGAPHPESEDRRSQIGPARASDQALKAAAQTLTDKLTDVEGEIYQYRNRSSQDPLNYPIRLNNKLAALQGIVESGDYKPTDQSYAVFKDLSSRLDQQLARLDALVRTELTALNKILAAQKLELVRDRGAHYSCQLSQRAAES